MEIKTSLDWNNVYTKFNTYISGLSVDSRKDSLKLIWSLSKMVNKLSQLELAHRRSLNRGKKSSACEEQVQKINAGIKDLEHWIFFQSLTQ